MAFAPKHLLTLVLLAAAAFLSPVQEVRAQWGDSYDAPRDPYYAPRRRASREDRRYAPPQQEAPRQFYWPWEDRPQPQVQPNREVQPRTSSRPARPRPPSVGSSGHETPAARKRTPSAAPSIAKPLAPAPAKTAPTVQVAVFGDSLASYLAKGLDDAFRDKPDVAVVDRSRGDSGIVRKDVVDWAKAAEDYLNANPKVAYGLFMVGVNDRQAIREGSESFEPLTDKWREIYAARIDAVAKVFTDHKIPLIWVNVPPVRLELLTKDLATINDIARERIQKAGQTYVDIWPGFVDDRNRYTATGPDLDGQRATLRTADGIHFTNPGARKVAHFADIELKRMIGANGTLPAEQPAVATIPSGTPAETGPSLDDSSAIDRKITAMLPSLPEPPGIPSLPVKPASGPVVPLGRAEVSPGGTLISGRPREGDAYGTVERTMQRGAAPMPQPGRADDFKWPPG
ncbi:SGNH/GDSL hydrolase family protein [Methylobacterium haplocladii]|nr:SGNH family hydrolase [Methylobacterium haplocladii]